MRSFVIPLLRLAAAAISSVSFMATLCATARANDGRSLVDQANSWSSDSEVPQALLQFRRSSGCLPEQDDSQAIFSRIDNYQLLKQVVLSTENGRVFDYAIEQALIIAGPTRLFGDLSVALSGWSGARLRSERAGLEARMRARSVLVEALSLDRSDFPEGLANQVLSEISQELGEGHTFDAVYEKYSARFAYSLPEKLQNGEVVQLALTRIGNLGRFMLFDSQQNHLPQARPEIPRSHFNRILQGTSGEVVVLGDPLSTIETVYRIIEAYVPFAELGNL